MEYVRTDADRVRDLYTIICNGELGDDCHSVDRRVNIVRELERLTCAEFKDTADFHRKVGAFIARGSSGGDRLREYRKGRRWTQEQLAIHLGVSKQFVQQMETGRRPLNDGANSLIRVKAMLPYADPQFACQTGIDSKQDTDAKKGVSDPEEE